LKQPYTFQDKTPKERKKNQRSPTSLGGISNQQTDPEVGPNYQPGKLNGGPGMQSRMLADMIEVIKKTAIT
jgi:hypothetical protein